MGKIKLKNWFNHPWWHWFFVNVSEYGTRNITIKQIDYVEHYCSKCNLHVYNSSERKYIGED